MPDSFKTPEAKDGNDLKWLDLVIQHVGSLRYGVVEIVMHDSRVTQIETTERVRLDQTEHHLEITS